MRIRKLANYVVIPLVALLIITVLSTAYVALQKQRIRTAIRITTPNGIQSLEQLELGGIKQWISVRGEDRDNPVLLFLHGGPGAPEMPIVRHYNRELEEHFVVVNWDQRGAGKSYARRIPEISMDIEQFISDTHDLTQILRQRFEEEKIYLVGHSWGTIVGTRTAQRYPELYHALVGIGQAVNFERGEEISYYYALDAARRAQHGRAVQELKAIGPPPYTGEDFLDKIGTQRKWLQQFGGVDEGERNPTRTYLNQIRLYLFAPEYSISDAINVLVGNKYSTERLWDVLLNLNLPEQVPSLTLPVYFFTGRHDYVTPFQLVEEYYEELEAPAKQIIWFEDSAHSPNFEEPNRFAEAMVNRVLRETYPQ